MIILIIVIQKLLAILDLWIDEEFLPAAYHPTREWDWCMPEDDKKRRRTGCDL